MQKKPHTASAGIPVLLTETLSYFVEKGYTADRALNETFRKYRVRDEEQRSGLATRFYGIIRFWRPLVTALGEDQFENAEQTRRLLGAWNAWKKLYHDGIAAEKQEGLDAPVADRLNKYMRVRKLRESYPDWLDEFAVQQLGEEKWEELSKALNRQPKLFLRANTLRTTREALIETLRKLGMDIYAPAEAPDAIAVKEFANVFALESFHEGLFEVQDISSQRVSLFLDVQPGMRVADACAGNGGKTLHLAALLKNRGRILAIDVVPKKLEELRARCTRNGVDLAETKLVDSPRAIKNLEGSFDRVLLDVPCTGTGVLRRNPDIRWRLYPEDVTRMMQQQEEIVNTYSSLVKSGGKMVYATCSIFPCEGEEQVARFLAAHSGSWEMEEEVRINPVSDDGDGFYMARMKKV